ncbi:4Fe-4S dicluster domain-containing protein [Methanocorpusculum sp.]|nr:4Fe-4S dicluster domain-containing protein [Methanocorpusculum sp.]
MQVAYIRKEKCNTAMCNRCVKFCPASRKDMPVIYIGRNKKATVVEELCNGCGKCVKICPEKAIEMKFIKDKAAPAAEAEEVKQEAPSKQTAPSQAAPAPAPKHKETPEEKKARKKSEHVNRVIRTAIACVLGMLAGLASFYLAGPMDTVTGVQPMPVIGLLVLVLAIVIQKTIFMVIRIDISKLGKKDWFYQGFMTFATWFLSWTMMLSTSFLSNAA